MNTSFWENLKAKPELHNYISPSIEIGYATFGPTVCLSGNLSASGKIVFIDDISLVIHPRGQEMKYLFEWLTFRPHQFSGTGYTGADVIMAAKFMVTPAQPHVYNILFSDQGCYFDLKQLFADIKKYWEAGQGEKDGLTPEEKAAAFEHFKKSPLFKEYNRTIASLCYWHAGDYEMTMNITTNKPKQNFIVHRIFTLPAAEEQLLRTNVEMIFADLCNLPDFDYYYATVPLRAAPDQ